MNGDIVEIPFNGSMMIAQKSDDGEIYAALKPICENIGIAYNGQWERLKRTPWATVRIIRTVGADGKRRDMAAISRKTLTIPHIVLTIAGCLFVVAGATAGVWSMIRDKRTEPTKADDDYGYCEYCH